MRVNMCTHPIFLFLNLDAFSIFPSTSPISPVTFLSPLIFPLPSVAQQEEGSSGRQATMTPLIIPVSVPVHRNQTDGQSGWAQGRLGLGERPTGQSDRKPSVIVARRRSIRNSMTESFGQVSSVNKLHLHCCDYHWLLLYDCCPQ